MRKKDFVSFSSHIVFLLPFIKNIGRRQRQHRRWKKLGKGAWCGEEEEGRYNRDRKNNIGGH